MSASGPSGPLVYDGVTPSDMCVLLVVSWLRLWHVIVVVPGHTHVLFDI